MTAEQAWEEIRAQIKRAGMRTRLIVISLALVVLGAFTLVFYVGIGLVAAGIIMLLVTVRSSRSNTTDINVIYEKYVLADWFGSVFDDVVFDSRSQFKGKELKRLGVFDSDWSDTVCSRCFTAALNGRPLRAAEVVLSGNPGADANRIGWNYEEPICFFWGRIWEIDMGDEAACAPGRIAIMQQELSDTDIPGKIKLHGSGDRLYLLHNVYSPTGAYPWWLPTPGRDNMDYGKLEREAKESARTYRKLLEKAMG